jgi:serine/threonine protein kinase
MSPEKRPNGALSLEPGSRLGRYTVIEFIAAGGMGEVCRARDPQLGRDVAIKILPGSVTHDMERLRRFEHESRATILPTRRDRLGKRV